MAKTIQSKKAALDASICSLATPRLCLLTKVGAGAVGTVDTEVLHDPTQWTEAAQYATTARLDLTGKLPAIAAATENTADTPNSMQLVFPTADVDFAAVAGSAIKVVAIAVVSGTGAFSSSTVGRVVDITDKDYAIGDVPRFAANSWTAKE